jgi:8-oxo-dGTP diphosphatase
MNLDRFSLRSAVYAMLIKDGHILLLRRFNTGWMDGWYSLPAGHLDGGETVTSATVREAREETGVEVLQKDLEIVHVMHRKTTNREYIDFFLTASTWQGTPRVAEPDKSDDLQWFPIDSLPENTVESVRHAIECHQIGVNFSEFGWN